MNDQIPFADDTQMARRQDLAIEFFSVTRPELIPFVSDEAVESRIVV